MLHISIYIPLVQRMTPMSGIVRPKSSKLLSKETYQHCMGLKFTLSSQCLVPVSKTWILNDFEDNNTYSISLKTENCNSTTLKEKRNNADAQFGHARLKNVENSNFSI